MAKAYCTGYYTGKVSRLPVDSPKPQNFSTSNDLQYTVWAYIAICTYQGIKVNLLRDKINGISLLVI